MSSRADDTEASDRWLEVLAGRAEPTDAGTRRAAALRACFETRLATEAEKPADPERLKTLLNLMEAEGEAAARAARAAGAGGPAGTDVAGGSHGPLSRLARWLFPDGGFSGWRLGGVAAGILGVAVLLRAVWPELDDESRRMKSVPPGAGTSAQAPATVTPIVVTGSDPLHGAIGLQSALRNAGLEAQVYPLGATARLEARVSGERAAAVRDELSRLGLAWSGGDWLVVEFKER